MGPRLTFHPFGCDCLVFCPSEENVLYQQTTPVGWFELFCWLVGWLIGLILVLVFLLFSFFLGGVFFSLNKKFLKDGDHVSVFLSSTLVPDSHSIIITKKVKHPYPNMADSALCLKVGLANIREENGPLELGGIRKAARGAIIGRAFPLPNPVP